MQLSTVEFALWPNRLCFGSGSLSQLSELASQMERRKAIIVCGRSVAEHGLLERVKGAMNGMVVGVFSEVEMQTPLPSVHRSLEYLRSVDADLVVSIGGGSAIDHGKGLVLLATTGHDYMRYCRNPDGHRRTAPNLPAGHLRHIAIPTTAGSSSEVLPTAGFREPTSGLKLLFRDQRLLPDISVLDPEMTLSCGPRLTASSGVTAVARCIEAC